MNKNKELCQQSVSTVPSAFTCIISFTFTREIVNSLSFWENTEQRAEQINLPRTHSLEQKFEPQMPLCSYSGDRSRFFFWRSVQPLLQGMNNKLQQSTRHHWSARAPGRHRCRRRGDAIIWEITHVAPLPKENEGPHWGLREEEWRFRMGTKPPGASLKPVLTVPLQSFWTGSFASVLKDWIRKLKGWEKWVCSQFGTDSIFLISC